MAGYAGTPLQKKLGLTAGQRVLLVDTPRGYTRLVRPWPTPVTMVSKGPADFIHGFFLTNKSFIQQLPKLKRQLAPAGLLWVSWPKGGKLGTDLNENIIRGAALGIGLVDVKVAAIDQTWSGLKLVYRLRDRP